MMKEGHRPRIGRPVEQGALDKRKLRQEEVREVWRHIGECLEELMRRDPHDRVAEFLYDAIESRT